MDEEAKEAIELIKTLQAEAVEDDENFRKEILAVYKKYKTGGVFAFASKDGMGIAATKGKTEKQVIMILHGLLETMEVDLMEEKDNG